MVAQAAWRVGRGALGTCTAALRRYRKQKVKNACTEQDLTLIFANFRCKSRIWGSVLALLHSLKHATLQTWPNPYKLDRVHAKR